MAASANARTVARLQVILEGNTKSLEDALRRAQAAASQAVKQVQSATSKVQGSLSSASGKVKASTGIIGASLGKIAGLTAAAFTVGSIVAFGKSCVQLGSDLSEVQNVVDVTFGSMSQKVDSFAKAAIKQFGLSEIAAKRYTSTMGAMLKSMGLSVETAYDMSSSLTGLAGDMASFYNIDANDAFEKLMSGISGETEPLKQLGINLSVANLEAFALSSGISKAYSSMTQAEQAILRYNYILQATSDAQGDFARTSGSWANQTRILSMQLDSLKASIGQSLIMVLQPALELLNRFVAMLSSAAERVKVFIAALTGTDLSSVSSGVGDLAAGMESTSSAAGNIGSSIADGMDDAAKATERFLLGFDEINRLGSPESELPAGMEDFTIDPYAAVSMGNLAQASGDASDELSGLEQTVDSLRKKLEPVINRAKELGSIFKSGFSSGIGDNFHARAESIISDAKSIGQHIKDIFLDPDVQSSANTYLNRVSYAMGQVAGSAVSIGTSIASNLVGGVEKFLSNNSERIKDYFVSMFDIGGDIFATFGNLSEAWAKILEPLGGEAGQELTGHIIGIFSNAFMSVTELAGKLARDIYNMFAQPIIINADGLQGVVADLAEFGAGITGTIEEAVSYLGDTVNSVYDEHIRPVFESLSAGLSDVLGIIVDQWNEKIAPWLGEAQEEFQALWEEHMKPMFDQLGGMLGSVGDALVELWNFIKPVVDWLVEYVFGTVFDILKGVFDTVMGVLGSIMDILGGVFGVIKGIIDFIVGVFTGDWEKAWAGAESVVMGFWDIIKGIIDGVVGLVTGLVDTIINVFSDIGSAIADGVNGIINWFGSLFGGGDSGNTSPAVPQASNYPSSSSHNGKGSAYTAMKETGTDADATYNAVKDAIKDSDTGDVNLYIDGEQLATATDKARAVRNTRNNPVYAY